MARDFIFSPGSKYACINCGRCCTHWAIAVEEKTAANILKYDWGAHYPDMKDKTFMIKRKSDVEGRETYYMKMRKDGRCPFLDDKKFCRIHSDVGYDAKPSPCKKFPLELTAGRRAVYARLSYYCPSVTAGDGQPLGAQRRWLETCLRESGARSLSEELYWAEGLKLSQSDASELDNYILDIIKTPGKTFAQRLALGGALIEAAATYVEKEGKNASGFLRETAKLDYQPLEEDLASEPSSPAKGRLAIGLFLIQDSRPTTLGRLLHFGSLFKFMAHVGGVNSHILKTKSSFGKASKISFEPLDEESESLLVRFFEHKIVGRRHLEGDMPLIGTWALFCAAYNVVSFMSRSLAAKDKRDKVLKKDVAEALGLADLLLVEHTLLLRMETTRRMIHTALSQPGMYKNLLSPL